MTLHSWTASLRDWQTRAVADVLVKKREDYLVTATPAAGKTRFALRIAHQYLADRAASRTRVLEEPYGYARARTGALMQSSSNARLWPSSWRSSASLSCR